MNVIVNSLLRLNPKAAYLPFGAIFRPFSQGCVYSKYRFINWKWKTVPYLNKPLITRSGKVYAPTKYPEYQPVDFKIHAETDADIRLVFE